MNKEGYHPDPEDLEAELDWEDVVIGNDDRKHEENENEDILSILPDKDDLEFERMALDETVPFDEEE